MTETMNYHMNDNDHVQGASSCCPFFQAQERVSLMLLWRHPPSEIRSSTSQTEKGGLWMVKYLIGKL